MIITFLPPAIMAMCGNYGAALGWLAGCVLFYALSGPDR